MASCVPRMVICLVACSRLLVIFSTSLNSRDYTHKFIKLLLPTHMCAPVASLIALMLLPARPITLAIALEFTFSIWHGRRREEEEVSAVNPDGGFHMSMSLGSSLAIPAMNATCEFTNSDTQNQINKSQYLG